MQKGIKLGERIRVQKEKGNAVAGGMFVAVTLI